MRTLLAAGLLTALASGCAPSCDTVCEKTRECDISPRLSQDECVIACEQQREEIQDADDTDLQDAFADHRRCIADATCEELQDGVCYDDELFPF